MFSKKELAIVISLRVIIWTSFMLSRAGHKKSIITSETDLRTCVFLFDKYNVNGDLIKQQYAKQFILTMWGDQIIDELSS